MCRAMNRSFISVIAGGFGADAAASGGGSKEQRPWKPGSAEDAAFLMSQAENVIIVPRSEEHTSELQSLMRISYAVFCLKKKHTQQLATTNDSRLHSNNHVTQHIISTTKDY